MPHEVFSKTIFHMHIGKMFGRSFLDYIIDRSVLAEYLLPTEPVEVIVTESIVGSKIQSRAAVKVSAKFYVAKSHYQLLATNFQRAF